jgi:hypothetical protein
MMPATWLIVWDIIIGIWAAWFIALVIISLAQSMWQSRDRWRLQTKRWWRSRSWARKPVLTGKWTELARLTSEFVDNRSKYGFAPKSIEGDVSCCWGYAGQPSRLRRPSHSLLPPFPPTPRHMASSLVLRSLVQVAGVAALGVAVAPGAVAGAVVVGATPVGAVAAAAAVLLRLLRLPRRAVAVAVGAAAVGVEVVGVEVVGMEVVGVEVVGNLWIEKSWLP